MIHNNITNKQKEILLLLYRFRFINRLHIQTILQHKTPITINRWLKDLTEKNYINRIFKRSWTENPTPAKYYISLNGIQFLKTQPKCREEYLHKLYREKDRSQKFIDRCLFITDVYLKFLSEIKHETPDNRFSTQSDLTPGSIVSDIVPDFLIITGKEGKQHFNLYQLFPEGVPRFAVRHRIDQYLTFLTEEDGTQLSASLYLVTQTEALHKYLTRYVKRLLEDESIAVPIYVSTYEHLTSGDMLKNNLLLEHTHKV